MSYTLLFLHMYLIQHDKHKQAVTAIFSVSVFVCVCSQHCLSVCLNAGLSTLFSTEHVFHATPVPKVLHLNKYRCTNISNLWLSTLTSHGDSHFLRQTSIKVSAILIKIYRFPLFGISFLFCPYGEFEKLPQFGEKVSYFSLLTESSKFYWQNQHHKLLIRKKISIFLKKTWVCTYSVS